MKSVLISINPKWCRLIAQGEKTVEVRKTKPKIDVPFKCYIYCTKDNTDVVPSRIWWKADKTGFQYILNGKVIGEFICDQIENGHYVYPFSKYINEKACLSQEEIEEYAQGKPLSYWHISNLVIYDKPKELSEFKKAGFMTEEQWLCNLYPHTHCHYEAWAKRFDITRPPQSWCFVEAVRDK